MHYKDFETYFAEFAASFIFAMTINLAIISDVSQPAIANAFAKATIGYAFENLTIKHANPAITLSCACIGLFSFASAFLYMFFQTCGYIAAAGISRLLYPKRYYVVFEGTQPAMGNQIIFLELFVSLFLSIVIVENIIFSKGLIHYDSKYTTIGFGISKEVIPFNIGAMTAVGAILASTYEGGAFNISFIFATFLVSNKYSFF